MSGLPQIWSWTYDEYGRVTTAVSPRTDVSAVDSYTYDSKGNVASISNALGHLTVFSDYDAHGHAGAVTDPNGMVTTYSYTVRGWPAAVSKGGQTTSFDYDGAGQLLQATFPDSSKLFYVYDSAHRLTSVTDSRGNKIQYALDNMGNRTSEQISGPSNSLARQITRVYNSLDQLKQITGGTR